MFIELYADGYECSSSKSESATTVCVTASNIRHGVKGCGGMTFIIAVVPAGLQLTDVLPGFCADMKELEHKSGTQVFCADEGKNVAVGGCVSILPADYPQLCKNCRHGGTASYASCPTCLTTKDWQMDVKEQLRLGDHDRIRTAALVDVCTTQAMKEGKDSENQLKEAMRRYGVNDEAYVGRMLPGLRVDVNRQSFRDRDHLFFGIFKTLLQTIMDKEMTKDARCTFVKRINMVEWPSGHTRFVWNPKAVIGAGVKMSYIRDVFFASVFCMRTLVTPPVMEHVCRVWALFRMIAATGLTKDEIKKAQEHGLKVCSYDECL